jgi:branched-chain amino acid transport system permease protein
MFKKEFIFSYKGLISICVLLLLFLFPLFSSSYNTFIFYSGLLLGLAAVSVNILLGYMGLVSFGHAAYFGIGAYTVALLTYYFNIQSMEVLLLAAFLTSLLISAIVGFLTVRHTEVYFALLTLAFGQLFYSLILKFYNITRGTDGISIPMLSLIGIKFNITREIFTSHYYWYYGIPIILGLLLLLWIIINSPFGLTLKIIRENPSRARAIGIPVEKYRWYAFILSGTITGIAGALYAELYGHVAPDLLHYSLSGELLCIALFGGYRSFIGPMIGGVIYTFLKSYLISITSYYWNFFLGIFLALVILFFRGGLMGGLNLLISLIRRGKI